METFLYSLSSILDPHFFSILHSRSSLFHWETLVSLTSASSKDSSLISL